MQLTSQQLTFFETFGYLKLPGLFAEEIDEIIAGFERVVTRDDNVRMDYCHELHGLRRRVAIPQFVTQDERLAELLQDERVTGIVRSILGDDYEYAESDGNLFFCESHWHSDMYGAPLTIRHVKLSFYLDSLRSDSGAIRVMPGTHFLKSEFGRLVRSRVNVPTRIEEHFGVDPRDLPATVVETDPGDLVVWDFRTVHASYNGGARRRLFSINFRERTRVPAEVQS